jgi:hypothetical protein
MSILIVFNRFVYKTSISHLLKRVLIILRCVILKTKTQHNKNISFFVSLLFKSSTEFGC